MLAFLKALLPFLRDASNVVCRSFRVVFFSCTTQFPQNQFRTLFLSEILVFVSGENATTYISETGVVVVAIVFIQLSKLISFLLKKFVLRYTIVLLALAVLKGVVDATRYIFKA